MADEAEGSAGPSDAQLEAAMQQREASVEAALRSGKLAAALRAALEEPPLATKNQAIKDKNAAIVHKALQALGAKEEQLTEFFSSMSADAADVLMKYISRGLAKPDNSALYLKIHALLVEKAGMGCLVRAMVDRKCA